MFLACQAAFQNGLSILYFHYGCMCDWFLHILLKLLRFLSFERDVLRYPIVFLNWIYLMVSWNIFHMCICHQCILFSRMSIPDLFFWHFLFGLFVYFNVEFWEFFIYSNCQSCFWMCDLKILFSICCIFFHPSNKVSE